MSVTGPQQSDPSDDFANFDVSQLASQAPAGLGPAGQVDVAPAASTTQAQLDSIATALQRVPKQTRAANGLPGDPVNFAFVGTADQLQQSLVKAGWVKADQSFGSDVEYGAAILAHKVDGDAPVSNLTLMGRKQDMAFEQAQSTDARHHLRVWQVGATPDGQPIWAGAATHDVGVMAKPNYLQGIEEGLEGGHFDPGLFLPTTHRIESNVDLERDKVAGDFASTGNAVLGSIPGFGKTRGTNGDGVTFTTDGQMTVIVAGR